MKKRIWAAVALSIAAIMALAGCGGDKGKHTGEAYGTVYGGATLCRVAIETSGDKIEKVEFDEVGLIYDWAKKSEIEGGDVAEADWVSVGEGDDHTYALKVQFGDKIFSLGENGKYALADGTQYEEYIGEKENAKYYWERMKAGDYHLVDKDGEKYSVTYKPLSEGESTDKDKRFFKSANGYWKAGGYGKGYEANMRALGDFIKAKGVGYDPENATKNDDGNIVLGGVDTGASVTGFADYYNLAKKAYESRLEAK